MRKPAYLVLGTVVAIAAVLAVVALRHGNDREGLTLLLRASARMSFAMFIAWLALPALARLRGLTEFAAEPYLLISFAAAHTIHVGVIFYSAFQGYFAQITERELIVVVLGGGSAYLLILLMGFTALRRPGRARAILRIAGAAYVFLVFTNSYVTRFREGEALAPLALALLLIAAVLRLAAWRARRAQPAAGAARA